MKIEIRLEDEVKCKYTGVKGIAMSKTEFVNGCIQFGVCPKYDKSKSIIDATAEVNLDSQSLVITKKGPRHEKIIEEEEFTGGPSRVMRRRM